MRSKVRGVLGAGIVILSFVIERCASTASSSAARSETRTIAGRQGPLVVDDGGHGDLPVLFVHGNGGNRTQWAAQLAHFRQSRRAVAFDLRGMGDSSRAGGDYSVEGFAEDVAAVADALRLSRFVLVGHSFGGAVVAAYAGKHPERLAGLVFADSAGDLRGTPPETIQQISRGLVPGTYSKFTDAWFEAILKGSRPETHDAVMRSLHATPRDVFTAATLGLYAFDFDQALSRFGGPRLSIASYLLESPVAVHRTVAGMLVQPIPNASHWLMMDQPAAFNRALETFLDGLR
jgi:pimeloyl-ACP methyl ester carboxylesterase